MSVPSRFKEALGFIKIMRSETPYHTKHENDFDVKYVEDSTLLKKKMLLESIESPISEHVYLLNKHSSFYHNLYISLITYLYNAMYYIILLYMNIVNKLLKQNN